MHRIDSYNAGPGGTWLDEIPGTRDATALTPMFMESIQEELASVIEGAGLTLAASGAADTVRDQLLAAIQKLNPVRAMGNIQLGATPTVVAGTGKNIASVANIAGVPNRLRVTFSTPMPQVGFAVHASDIGYGLGATGNPTSPVFPSAVFSTVNSVDIKIYNSAGAEVDPAASPRVICFSVLLP